MQVQGDAARARPKSRVTLSFVLVLLLVAALAPLSPAQATHDVSHPQPSAPSCEWYGSVEFTRTLHTEQPENGSTDQLVKGEGWSGASTDSTCRGTVHYLFDQYDTYGDLWWSQKANGTVPATYEAGFTHWELGWGDPGGFSVSFTGGDTIPLHYTDSSGSTSSGETDAGAGAGCQIPGAETRAGAAAIQAIVVTCSQIQGASEGETWTGTIRMRRTVCDRTIDSDGDKLSDCREFALQTDTHNPDTDGDGLTDGQEVLIQKTDPLDTDTDDGGIEDGNEVDGATDPLDPTDDLMNCHYINTSFVAGWQGDFNIEQPPGADPLHWMRYSWSDVRYCVDSAGVRLATTGSQDGAVNLPEDIAYFFHLLDFKVKYAGSDSVSVERLANDSLEAKVKGRFKFCSGIPILGTIVGKGIKAVLKIVPDRFEQKLLEWGPRRIFESSLIPTWIKNEIVERGFKAVLNSFDALSAADHKAIMYLFKWIGEKVGGNLAKLVLGDLLCFTVWRPEIVATITADGASDTFAQGPTGPFEVMKDF